MPTACCILHTESTEKLAGLKNSMNEPFYLSPTAIHYPFLSPNQRISGITSLALDNIPPNSNFLSQPPIAGQQELLSGESYYWLSLEKVPPAQLVLARQVHGTKVQYVESPGIYSDVDGFFTDRQLLQLTIRTADCAAVMVSFPQAPAVGIAHAGWRGARENIVETLLGEMLNCWPVERPAIRIAIAPHIKKCCYTVGEEFTAFFSPETLQRREGRLYFDLEKAIVSQLRQLGIGEEQITVASFCTACGSIPLHSFRKQRTTRRLLNIIAITGGD